MLSSVGAWTFRTMISHQRPLSTTYDNLSLTNTTCTSQNVSLDIALKQKAYICHHWGYCFFLQKLILPLTRVSSFKGSQKLFPYYLILLGLVIGIKYKFWRFSLGRPRAWGAWDGAPTPHNTMKYKLYNDIYSYLNTVIMYSIPD
jgi:hypothetical protein